MRKSVSGEGRTNHRVTENTEKKKEQEERQMPGVAFLLFFCLLCAL
jgi:hypothetical protein